MVALVAGAGIAGMDAVIDQIAELPMVTGAQTHVIRDISDS